MSKTALQRAIYYLNAVEITPGRYVWRDHERGRYRVVDEEMMEALGWQLIYHIAPHDTIRMAWENQEMGVDMEEWWKPERQFAVYHPVSGEITTYNSCSGAWRHAHNIWLHGGWSQYEHPSKVVTVDLNTGEEIPA